MLNIDEFKYYLLTKKGLKPPTVYRHINILKLLIKARSFTNGYITKNSLEEYIAKRLIEGRRHSYLDDFIILARHHTTYLQEQNKECDPSVFDIPFLKKQAFEKATMTYEEIEAFLALPAPLTHARRGKNGKMVWWNNAPKLYDKWTVFFTICAYSGMRMGEVAQLTINDVDFGRNVFIVKDGKTGSRIVPIAPNIVDSVKNFLNKLTNDNLFPGVDNADWHYNFHQRITRLNIRRTNLSPYSLRHSFITALLSEDVNLFKVQRIVGHKRLETTAHYTHLVTKDIQQAITKHPIIRKNTDPEVQIQACREVVESFGFRNNPKFEITESYENGVWSFSVKIVKS
ncbi:MAG: site-specific integrase [Candidatus Berkelbacteria bacterium]|nr:site-specific integrase [Candidatus Berkelbacteria bacterium]